MIIDAQLLFSDSQALTATAVSTNILDLKGDNNLGIGVPMAVVVSVEVAADFVTGNETYQFDLQTDTVVGLSSPTVIGSIAPLATVLVAGYQFAIVVPPDTSCEQYLRMNYILGGTTPTITVSTSLVPVSGLSNIPVYAKGYTIS